MFLFYPEEWRGATILRFADGRVLVERSMFANVRSAMSEAPTHSHVIADDDTYKKLVDLVTSWYESGA